MTGLDFSWIQWKAIKVPSGSAMGCNVLCDWTLSTKRQKKIRSIREVHVPDIPIIWLRPTLSNNCGAVLLSGLGLKIGYLQ